ncbi:MULTISPECIES: LLM class flavin-dependent oxidoreductase [Streptomyces]|uniref:LLM class flavin-dependent oxidoreductase n=1 Tax=Streptomyces flavovirens TaxID=52258 RepID=A0ABV8N833_9ACTN|nr:LLM class flavin-dependent oxidoreductase [Streptomyces sp. MBT51]MBK3592493.1 LLM class flavin-dependent oxidoreductase [Streptomyces sp. MBT51]
MTGGTGMLLGYELPGAGLTDPVGFLLAAARQAEAAGVDHVILGDGPAAHPDGPGAPASLIAASLLAVETTRIGLVMSAATAYYEPYNLARMLASVDHISKGRAGWRVVTGLDGPADANHRREGVEPMEGREARAAEFVPVVRGLWDTWEDGAFVHEKDTGRFIDGDRIHVLDHEGPALRVRGPLNVIRPPQGHPVVLADATDLAVAPAADILMTGHPDSAPSAADAGGRPRLGTVMPFVAATEALAHERHARAGGPRSDGARAVLVGDAEQVAERLGDWFDHGAVDGFTLSFSLPDAVGDFTDTVLPRLRAAERFRTAYTATTLRGRLGLSRPAHRVADPVAAATERG